MPQNITGAPVTGSDLFGRSFGLQSLWESIENGADVLMLAPRRVGKTSLMLQLREAPRPGWSVFYIDLEGGNSPADLIAEMLTCLATHPDFKIWLDLVPFRKEVSSLLGRLSTSVQYQSLKVELKQAIATDWRADASRLEDRLREIPQNNRHVLFVLDELPILLARILSTTDGLLQAEELLTWFRSVRQDTRLGAIQFLSAGSIGLEGVLRKYNLSAHINDLKAFHVEPWTNEITLSFVKELGIEIDFEIPPDLVEQMLLLLGQLVPYHVQLFYDVLRTDCRGKAELLDKDRVEMVFNERLAGSSGTAHLDHYANRLETVFSSEELAIANQILDRACKSPEGILIENIPKLPLFDPTKSRRVLRILSEDGYLKQSDISFRFSSNLLRVWWQKTQSVWG